MGAGMNRIFVGYDQREDIAYRVLKKSLEKRASRLLDIQPLVLKNLGFRREPDPLASTEFTYTRFLVPWLCDYQGIALYVDCDMLCLGDIQEVFDLDMRDYSLRVVKHDYRPKSKTKMDGRPQTQYPRKNWSSFMLMDCAKLKVWTKEAVETMPARWLHRFEPIDDALIGDIPKEWNVLDRYDERTKLIHYTEGGPWFPNYEDHPFGDIWLRHRDEYLAVQAVSQ